jgi:uncharacterized protein with GYD domain
MVMPRWISLVKLTEQGIRNIKQAPERLEESIKGIEALGGKLVDFYMVMGEYDYVVIVEGPSDEAAMIFLMGLGASGNLRTTTLKAFTRDAFEEMVGKVQ